MNKQEVLFDLTKKSFEEIIMEVAELEIEPTEEFEIKNSRLLSVIVGLSGNIEGRILLSTTYDDAKKITRYMNFGEDLDNDDDIFIYLAEFANMYCGRTVTHMNDEFSTREIWITPPAIFSANDLNVISPHLSSDKAYYQSEAGNFIIDVGYKSGDGLDEF